MKVPAVIEQEMATIAWRAYAAHSYLYYVKDEPILADEDFDQLCRFILKNFDWIKPFDLNDYLDEAALEAGTGYQIAEKVTGMTRDHAEGLLEEHLAKSKKKKKKNRNIEDLLG